MWDSIRDVEQSVARMCQLSQVDVRPQLPALFTKLVHQMRALDARALNQLHSSTTAPCEKAKYVSYIYADVHASFSANSPSVAHSFTARFNAILIVFRSMHTGNRLLAIFSDHGINGQGHAAMTTDISASH